MPETEREVWLAAVGDDWRRASLDAADAALCAYAELLTHAPADMREEHLVPLRAAGLEDRAIHDAVQVIAYFNYINRVADALHVEVEPGT
ncbi:MAG TPA: peroxidase [Planctomycetota bacterium]|nr:peroxidase [Planctomycetota bacterium]